MAINFPNAPSVNDTFTSSGKVWYYTGTTWTLKSIISVPDGGIGTSALASNSVTTVKIANNSITYDKLGSDVEIPFIMGVY